MWAFLELIVALNADCVFTCETRCAFKDPLFTMLGILYLFGNSYIFVLHCFRNKIKILFTHLL